MCILSGEQNPGKVPDGLIDLREQLCNQREIGPYPAVQLVAEQVALLHGFFLDLDLPLLRPGPLAPGLEAGPAAFFE
jgi:hypothetical protein